MSTSSKLSLNNLTITHKSRRVHNNCALQVENADSTHLSNLRPSAIFPRFVCYGSLELLNERSHRRGSCPRPRGPAAANRFACATVKFRVYKIFNGFQNVHKPRNLAEIFKRSVEHHLSPAAAARTGVGQKKKYSKRFQISAYVPFCFSQI